MASGIPKDIRASLYIDGKPAEASLKNVEQVTRTLVRELKGLTIGTEAWNNKMKEVAANKKYLKEVKDEVNGVGGAFSQLKAELGKVGTLAAGYLGFQFISDQFQGIISGNAKLSDSLADIRRVTGLTEAGVLDLDKSLGKLDTRTSKSGLREIAVIAGKLGVAKNEILDFVKATDMLSVALGDELGNADEITTQLGKILNVFEGKVNGDNITRLGNAMVKLANDGVASGGFIAKYTQLVSGIAETAGLSLPATLALGAGLEELGGRAESSATATQKLLISITQNKDAYKIAGVSLADFNKMLAESPDKALLTYTRGLVQNKNAFNEVTQSLKDAGEEGSRTIELITKIGSSYDFFTRKIDDAKEAYQGYNEIIDAFNLKNDTLGAKVDKLGKDFNKLGTNVVLKNFFTKIIILSTDVVRWLDNNSKSIANLIKVLVVAGTAWAGYRLAAVLAGTWTVAVSAWMATAKTVTLLYALATATLTGNTLRAAAAQRVLGLAIAATPWGAVLAIVSGLAASYMLFTSKIENAARIQQNFNDISAEASKSFDVEKNKIDALLKVLVDKNATDKQRLDTAQELRRIMPEHLKGYTDEEIVAGKASVAIMAYVDALKMRFRAEAAAKKLAEIQSKTTDIETQLKNGYSESSTIPERLAASFNQGNKMSIGDAWKKAKLKEIEDLKAQENEVKAMYEKAVIADISPIATNATAAEVRSLDFLKKKLEEVNKARNETTAGSTTFNKLTKEALALQKEIDKYSISGAKGADKKAESEKERVAKKAKEQQEKLRDDLKKIGDDIYKNSLDKYDAEVFAISEKYNALREKAQGNADDLVKIDELEGQEVTALIKKNKDEAVKLADEAAKKRIEIEWQVFEATASSYDLEVAQAEKKYDALIALARANGLTTIELEKAKKKAIDDINLKGLDFKSQKEIDLDKNEFYVQAAQEVSNAVFAIGENSRRQESDSKIKQLEDQRNAELSNKDLTDQEKLEINARYDAKVHEEKVRAFKAEKAMSIAQALVNGALAVTKVLAQTGVLSPFAIPAIVAGTLSQIAIIAAQSPPEYAEGGMTNEDPSGYVSKATIFNRSASGRPFVAGEKGREWIAPNWMLNNPRTANIIGTLEMARKEKRMFANGGFNDFGGTGGNTQGYDFYRLEEKLDGFINTQARFNKIPVILNYQEKEEYERKLQFDRSQQTA